VDLDRFRPMDRSSCLEQLGWPADRKYVLTYGTDAGKRLDLAHQAVNLVAAGTPVELKILSGVDHSLVPIWLNAASVFLVTSSAEGSPNTVKEALACDLPVISTDVGDVRERISAIEGCAVVSPEPTEIVDALRRVL